MHNKINICPKCADTMLLKECPFCKIQSLDTGVSWDEWLEMTMRQKDELLNHYRKNVIKETYDSEAEKLRKETEKKSKSFVGYTGPRCPYCKSSFVSKVTFFDRLLDTTVWGLASDMIGKTHKCNSCGATW